MISVPFLIFYTVGMTLDSTLPYFGKAGLLFGAGLLVHTASRHLLDESLINILPMSLYFATKVWNYYNDLVITHYL